LSSALPTEAAGAAVFGEDGSLVLLIYAPPDAIAGRTGVVRNGLPRIT
jgi:hypothetical protein